MAELMAVLQDIDKCIKCRGCVVACERNWPRHQNTNVTATAAAGCAGPLLGAPDGGTAEKISPDDPTVVKGQRTGDRAPYVKYNCWHCPSPPCVAACLATGRAALSQNPDGSVHIEQHKNPSNPWDKQWCNPDDPKCKTLGGRLVCVEACQRGGYPRVGKGDGLNKKVYKCTLCGTNAQEHNGRVPGDDSMWIGYDANETSQYVSKYKVGFGYDGTPVPACVASCPSRALLFGTRANCNGYAMQTDWTELDGVRKGTALFPYKAGHSPYPDRPEAAGGYIWVSRNVFGHPTGDPYVEDHAVPMLEMLLESPAGKMLVVPTLVAGGLYALYERKKARARAEATI